MALLSLGGLLRAATPPSILNLEKSSIVEFLAVGSPSAIKIRGKITGDKPVISGVLRVGADGVSGSASVLLDAFDTGMELRNKHMREKYLETRRWPTAELVFSQISLPESCAKTECESSKIPFEGTLALHGTQKTVSGLMAFKRKNNAIEASFEFKFPLSTFGITTPSFMGISVTQDVAVIASVGGALAIP